MVRHQPYRIVVSPVAAKMIREIRDRRAQRQVLDKIKGLANDPEDQGRALLDEFAGRRRIPAAGRYRIIYTVRRLRRVVLILAVGIRREGSRDDVYRALARLIGRGEA
jgi:mRNA interferase RelE/StbE